MKSSVILLCSFLVFSFLYYCVSYLTISFYQDSAFLSKESLFFLTRGDWKYNYFVEILVAWLIALPTFYAGWCFFRNFSKRLLLSLSVGLTFFMATISQVPDYVAVAKILDGQDIYTYADTFTGGYLLRPDIVFVSFYDLLLLMVGIFIAWVTCLYVNKDLKTYTGKL